MHHAVVEMNHRGRTPGGAPMHIGTGMHTGSLMMGVIGDAKRLDGGLVADTVNTAARVEGLTKVFGAKVLLSETAYQQIADPGRFRIRYLGPIQVKGRATPLGIYECLDAYEEPVAQRFASLLPQFDEAMSLYLKGDFRFAAMTFADLVAKNPLDQAARRFEARSQHWLAQGVPQGWNGVEEMTEK
ncbi:MAG: hypothetical protein OHK0039_13800 [Bacteroidia bacterium]